MKPPSGALTPPARLRRVNHSVSTARVDLRVEPGDELEVSEAVAAQLGPEFQDPADVPDPAPQVVRDENGEIDYDATDPEALRAAGLERPAVDPPAAESEPAPVKRPRKPKAADASSG